MSGSYPIIVMQDRCSGVYSGGVWLAIACANDRVDDGTTRVESCLDTPDGPSGSDVEAGSFWIDAPSWIAVGGMPDGAFDKLRKFHP
jgi:hypothetical protein